MKPSPALLFILDKFGRMFKTLVISICSVEKIEGRPAHGTQAQNNLPSSVRWPNSLVSPHLCAVQLPEEFSVRGARGALRPTVHTPRAVVLARQREERKKKSASAAGIGWSRGCGTPTRSVCCSPPPATPCPGGSPLPSPSTAAGSCHHSPSPRLSSHAARF